MLEMSGKSHCQYCRWLTSGCEWGGVSPKFYFQVSPLQGRDGSQVHYFLLGFGLNRPRNPVMRIYGGHGLSHPYILCSSRLQAILDVLGNGAQAFHRPGFYDESISASWNVVPVSMAVGGQVLRFAGEFATPSRRVGQSTTITLSPMPRKCHDESGGQNFSLIIS